MRLKTLMVLLLAYSAAGATNNSSMTNNSPNRIKRIDMRKAIRATIDSQATWGGGFNAYLHLEAFLR